MSSLKILIIKPSSFGDIVHGLQAVEATRDALAANGTNVEVHWVVRDIFVELLKCSSAVDKLFIFNRHGGLFAFYKLIKEIRADAYDIVFDYQGLFRSGLITHFARSTRKIGRKDSKEFSSIFYKEVADLPNGKNSHAAEILCSLSKKIGLNCEPKRPISFLQYNWPYSFNKKTYIAIFPNSRGPKKEWKGFFDLTKQLVDKKINVVLLGPATNEEFSTIRSDNLFNLFGKTSISELPAIINEAKCVVANDSGPLHLAAALKIPLVGIYGPTNPQNFGPYPAVDSRNVVMYNKSLKTISHIDVIDQIEKIITL